MDKDIQEMFRSKNRQILITNLKYDLDKNINSLLDTITNIFNLEFDTAIKNILTILADASIDEANKYITDKINSIKMKSYTEIEILIMNKKNLLEEKINVLEFEEDQMNEYYDFVFETTKHLKDSFKEKIGHIFDEIDKELEKYIVKLIDGNQEELACNRVTDYLNNRLYGKLETKIHMEIMLRDNNLINKAKEGYIRFQEITLKTMKN